MDFLLRLEELHTIPVDEEWYSLGQNNLVHNTIWEKLATLTLEPSNTTDLAIDVWSYHCDDKLPDKTDGLKHAQDTNQRYKYPLLILVATIGKHKQALNIMVTLSLNCCASEFTSSVKSVQICTPLSQ